MSNLSSAASSRKVRNKMAEFSFGNPQREPIRSEMTLEEMDKPREGSRAALIAGGRLNEISEGPFRIQCQEYYRESLAVTRAVWQLVDAAVKNKQWRNSYPGVLNDILYMSKRGRPLNPYARLFSVVIKGAGNRSLRTFKVVTKLADTGELVSTIMLPEEG